ASWDWGTDYTTCDVTLTCTSTEGECDTPTVKDTIKTTSEETTKATCEGEGVITYTATYEYEGKTYSDTRAETVDALGHTWPATDDEVNVDWDWTGRTEDAVTLTVACTVCGEALVHEDVEYEADGDDETLLVASYTVAIEGEDGYTYESTYNTENDDAAEHHHHYGEPTWNWTSTDDGYAATATFTCKSVVGTAGDPDEEEIEIEAEVTYEITTTATCTENGVMTFTATVEFDDAKYTDAKEVTISQTGHDWDTANPSWEWSEDAEGQLTATLTFICKNDASHEWSGTDSNVTDSGDGSYTATVLGPDGTTSFEDTYTPLVELDIPVHIDFNDPSTYDFISFGGEIKDNTEVVVGTDTSYTSGIITYVPLSGAKILDVPVSETENIMTLTTKGNTTSSGGYFEINLTKYIGQTVKITLVMTANTESDSNGRSMFITKNKTDTAYSESTVLQYGTSYGKDGANPTVIEYIGTITSETSIIYITSYGNNCIISLDVVLADASEIPEVTITDAHMSDSSITLNLANGQDQAVVTVVVTMSDNSTYNGHITWSLSEDSTGIVTLDENGGTSVTVTAISEGDVTLTCTVDGTEYTFTVTISVINDADASNTFESFIIEPLSSVESFTKTEYAANAVVEDNTLFSLTAGVALETSLAQNNEFISNGATFTLVSGESYTPNYGITHPSDLSAGTREDNMISLTAKENIMVHMYFSFTNKNFNGGREGSVFAKIGGVTIQEYAVTTRNTAIVFDIYLAQGETLVIGTINSGSSGTTPWFYGVEASVSDYVDNSHAEVQGLVISEESIELVLGDPNEGTYTLSVTGLVLTDNTVLSGTFLDGYTFVWYSADTACAAANDGVITAVAAGNTTIYAYVEESQEVYGTCSVTVSNQVTLQAGTYSITATVTFGDGKIIMSYSVDGTTMTGLSSDYRVAVTAAGSNGLSISSGNWEYAGISYGYRAQLNAYSSRGFEIMLPTGATGASMSFVLKNDNSSARTAYLSSTTSSDTGVIKSATGASGTDNGYFTMDTTGTTLSESTYYLFGGSDSIYLLSASISYTLVVT
ncbi:MAG: hypothetical protein LUD72_06555, partial [Bacteroidales bacterium]|nr:hypothetical protein [Bacteroidales bacterium]